MPSQGISITSDLQSSRLYKNWSKILMSLYFSVKFIFTFIFGCQRPSNVKKTNKKSLKICGYWCIGNDNLTHSSNSYMRVVV